MIMKTCIKCHEKKELANFYLQGGVHKGSGRTYSSCKKCHNRQLVLLRQNDSDQAARQKNRRRAFRSRNPEKEKRWNDKYREELTDGVVSNSMGLRKHEAPPQLIECKRVLIKLKRLIQHHENEQH